MFTLGALLQVLLDRVNPIILKETPLSPTSRQMWAKQIILGLCPIYFGEVSNAYFLVLAIAYRDLYDPLAKYGYDQHRPPGDGDQDSSVPGYGVLGRHGHRHG